MGSKVAKNILKINKDDNQKDKNKIQPGDSIDDFEIRIDLVFPEFEIRHDSIDNMFQGNSILDRKTSEYEYSKIDKSIWIQDINDDIQINRKFGRKVQNPFWVKKFKKNEENEKIFLNELLILSNLSHPFIITEKDYFQDDDNYYIVFEDYPGIPILEYYMKNKHKIGFTQIKLMIRDLLNVLKYIHMKKIAIRNLNPGNIYYDGDNLMLCNFERAEFFENVRQDQLQNSKPKQNKKNKIIKFSQQFIDKYLQAPEMKKKNYSYQADIWAVGLIYLVFFQNPPKGFNKKLFKLRQYIIDEFCPGFTLEISPEKTTKMRRKSTLNFKRKLSKKLGQLEEIDQEDTQQEQQTEEESNLILDLTQRQPYYELLFNLLKTDPKQRLDLDKVEEQSIFADRIKLEDEKSFMEASLSIYNFLKRNDFLTPLKKFYVSTLMTYKVKSKYANVQACFDLDGSGYLDQGEFILGVKRTSPETSNKEAKKIYKQIDIDGNGFIEFEEFCVAFIGDDFITSQQILKQFFEYFVENDRRVVIKNKLFKQLDMTSSKYKKVKELASDFEELELHNFLQLFRKVKSQLQGRQIDKKRNSKFIKVLTKDN